MMKEEIRRRDIAGNFLKIRVSSWLKTKLYEWLKLHPEKEQDSVDWLLKTEGLFYRTLKEAAEETLLLKKEKLVLSNWVGPSNALVLSLLMQCPR
jgi:hypothetical protein